MTRYRPRGDEQVMIRRDGVSKPRPPAPPKPKPPRVHPERTPRTSETVGGPGVVLPKGAKMEGNMPNCTLTDSLFNEIVSYVRAGNFRTVAMKAAGVPSQTFWYWISVGREQIQELIDGKREVVPLQAQLVMALDRAEGRCFVEQQAIVLRGTEESEDGNIVPADIDDRKLRLAWLQRRFAREWTPPTTGTDDETGAAKKIDVTELLLARLQMLRDADG